VRRKKKGGNRGKNTRGKNAVLGEGAPEKGNGPW